MVKCLPLQTWGPEFSSAAATYKPGIVDHTQNPNAGSEKRKEEGWRQAEP